MDPITWTDETRQLTALSAWARNPRKIENAQAKRLQESFKEFGQPEQIVIGPDNVPALVLCEGELNAMSVWQDTMGAVDVLSLGLESAHLTKAAIQAILKYERVIVWMDRGGIAKNYMAALPGAVGLKSPQDNDANDWLQKGGLPKILQEMIEG